MKCLFLASCLLVTPAITRAQASSLAQDFKIVFNNPDRERYVEGPGLVRLDDGSLVAVVPVVPREEWAEPRRTSRTSCAAVMEVSHGSQSAATAAALAIDDHVALQSVKCSKLQSRLASDGQVTKWQGETERSIKVPKAKSKP